MKRAWKSTKLHLTLIAMALVTGIYGVVGFTPGEFSQYCIAIVSLTAAYAGANAAQKFAKPPTTPPPGIG